MVFVALSSKNPLIVTCSKAVAFRVGHTHFSLGTCTVVPKIKMKLLDLFVASCSF